MNTINVLNETLAALDFFKVRAPVHLMWFSGGLFGVVCNVLVIITIVKSKDLQSSSHLLITSLSFADALYAFTYCWTGLKRYVLYLSSMLDEISQLKCLLQCLPLSMLSIVTHNLTLMLSVDRLILIARPMYYRKLYPKRYIVIINCVSWSIGTFIVMFIFYDNDYQKILLVCTSATSFSLMFHQVSSYFANIIELVTVFICAIALIILFLKKRMNKKLLLLENETEQRRSVKTRASFTITALLSINILIWINGLINSFIVSHFDPGYVVRIGPYMGVVAVFSTSAPFIIYLIMSKNFRSAFVKIFCKKTTTVSPTELVPRIS